MGFIRGGLSFFIGILLFFSFLAMNFFLTLDLSLDYENVKPKLSSAVKDLAQDEEAIGIINENLAHTESNCQNETDFIIEQDGETFEVPCSVLESVDQTEINFTEKINEEFGFAESYCENNTDFVFSQEGQVFEIPCSVVDQGPEKVIEYGINQKIEEFYYKSYDCGFFECLRTEFPFFLVSEQAKDSSKNRFYFYLFLSLILITVMFFLAEKKSSWLIIIGSLLVISSLPFFKISAFLSFLDDSFLEFVLILFSESYKVFLISFIIGVAIVGLGVLLKFLNFGNSIANIFSKINFKRKTSKEEVTK
jgi:hypothetical protein|tara:strand:+ start:13657 stop:14577 length:921 start_codon:yes stop_codon:yes gene_type:complete